MLLFRECQWLGFLLKHIVLFNVYNPNYCINPVVCSFILIALQFSEIQTPKIVKGNKCQPLKLNKILIIQPNTYCMYNAILPVVKETQFKHQMTGLIRFYQSKRMAETSQYFHA